VSAHLQANELTMRFEGVTANDDITIEVSPGEVVGLIGPNGAGKTTLFNCVTGFLRPTSGSVRLDGSDITALPPDERARLGMVRTFQQTDLFDHLDVRENLLLGRHARYGVKPWRSILGLPSAFRAEASARDTVDRIAQTIGLGDALGRRIDELPYGARRLVEVGRALAAEPRLLLLDEPSAGMDGRETAYFAQLLREIHESRGLSMLVIEHDVAFVMGLCRRIYVLDFGRLIAVGSPDEIRDNADVRAAFLGTESVRVVRSRE
jgi:branched-chain amino acid transport system ATP-binding protein